MKRKSKILVLTCFIIMISNIACFTDRRGRNELIKSAGESYDMVIVPGVTFLNGKWDRTMKGRIYWSKYLYDKGIAKNVMYSGGAVRSPYYEGNIMALYAEAIGIPREHIFTEIKAEHSTENVYYSYQKAKKLGFNKIAVASDPFQIRLLRRFTRNKVDRKIKMFPFITDTLKMMEPSMTDPEIKYDGAFSKEYISIDERDSFWKRWRGTRGKNLNKNLYQ